MRSDTGEVLAERLGRLGVTTNNVAEYTGLIEGLRAASELGADEVEVRMDSKLVVEQMSGRWQIKHPGLRPLAEQAGKLARTFRVVRYSWIPRERNKHADRLANAAMDGKDAPDPPAAAVPAVEPRRSRVPTRRAGRRPGRRGRGSSFRAGRRVDACHCCAGWRFDGFRVRRRFGAGVGHGGGCRRRGAG
ncbi:hypothetical protein GCM10027610_099530 [Dactylosporangium cerinum]